MIGLDTNVLIRFLTKDDERKWQQAVEVIDRADSCFISNIVLCEIVWVLRGKPYQYPQEEILKTLELMLATAKFEFENRSVIYQAIAQCLAKGEIAFTKQGKADFADYLIGAIDHENGCIHTVTFERKLKTAKRFKVLELL